MPALSSGGPLMQALLSDNPPTLVLSSGEPSCAGAVASSDPPILVLLSGVPPMQALSSGVLLP